MGKGPAIWSLPTRILIAGISAGITHYSHIIQWYHCKSKESCFWRSTQHFSLKYKWNKVLKHSVYFQRAVTQPPLGAANHIKGWIHPSILFTHAPFLLWCSRITLLCCRLSVARFFLKTHCRLPFDFSCTDKTSVFLFLLFSPRREKRKTRRDCGYQHS